MNVHLEVELVELIRVALVAADELDLPDVALHLNEALVALTGEGLAPMVTDVNTSY